MDREFIKIERTQGGWQMLFQKLHQIARANAGSQAIAKKPMNVTRNRYRDVLPIDSTRVVLDDPDNDYINANFVKNEEVGRTYILCQGPLPQTCPHFWQMIWEQKTTGIIMLNKCVERGMNKCFPYWPQPNDPPMDLEKLQVEYVKHEDESCYRLSHLKLTDVETEESREILHFHYTKWPDFGVPSNPEVFLEFLYAVRQSKVLDPDKGPAVVHCSAGIGRSGTFCIVDTLLAKLEETKDIASVDLQPTLLEMRQQRLGLVQTADQLRFSYIAVLQGALQDMGLEPSSYDDLVEEEEEEEEEEDEDEDEDEVEESDSDEDERFARKYPNLTKPTSSSGPLVDFDDTAPPPLPPRPPETLVRPTSDDEEEEFENNLSPPPSPPTSSPPSSHTSPPPPPSSAPPGPPTPYEQEEVSTKKLEDGPATTTNALKELDSDEEFGFEIPISTKGQGLENGGLSESDEVEELEESGAEEAIEKPEANPPPIPPRSHSLSPSPSMPSYGSKGALRTENASTKSSTPFLAEGRGGAKVTPPRARLVNGIASNGELDEEEIVSPPPPLPAKSALRRRSTGPKLEGIAEEERMLMNELDLLEKLVDSKETSREEKRRDAAEQLEQGRSPERKEKARERKKLRDEKRARLDSQVTQIREEMRRREGDFESDWSIPWLLVGFVVMLGYCAYYIIQ